MMSASGLSLSNGRIPDSDLVTVAPGEQLAAVPAAAYLAMEREAAREGVTIAPYRFGTYRSRELQAEMRANPAGHGVAKGIVLAAVGASTHGLGFAVDIRFGLDWVVANGARFGFTRPSPKGDPAHFVHNGRTVLDPAQITDTPEEENMLILLYNAPSASHKKARRAVGEPFRGFTEGLTDADADRIGLVIRRQLKLPDDTAQAKVTVNVDDVGYEQFKALCTPPDIARAASALPAGVATKADVAASEGRLAADIRAVPAAVIVEQKKAGN